MGKGMPSAVLLSIVIHAALFLLAGMLVVFTVVKKEEKKFTPPKAVERPKMKLKKPKVKVKKTSKPKSTTRIVTKMNRASMPDIQLPEMSGMGEGLGEGIGGFDMMPDLDTVSVFGSGQTIGNDFIGTFYDHKRDRSGRPIPYSGDVFLEAMRKFIRSGWKESTLARYYQSPKKRYTTMFVVPPTLSALVPAVFGEPEVEGTYWSTLYKGQLIHKEGITFRFMGWGDGAMAVRVDGKIVLLSGRLQKEREFWHSSTGDDRKYTMGNGWAAAGDWITLEAGVPLNMEVFMTEAGGVGSFMIAVQEQGVEYERRRIGVGPIFPAFKTAEPSHDLLDVIYKDLTSGEICLTNGPVFCDYAYVPSKRAGTNAMGETDSPEAAPPEPEAASALRSWTSVDGKTVEAEYIMVIGDKVVLKTARGKQKKIPLAHLSPEDRAYTELVNPPTFKIDFTTKTEQVFSIVQGGSSGTTVGYDYRAKARLKQTSAGQYNHRLRIDFFAIGKEIAGNRYILLDRQQSQFTPTAENQRSHEFSGKTVRLEDLWAHLYDSHHRGQKTSGYLITVADERGEIIQHEESSAWLYGNLENLKQLPVRAYMDKNCIRRFPTSPPPPSERNRWGK